MMYEDVRTSTVLVCRAKVTSNDDKIIIISTYERLQLVSKQCTRTIVNCTYHTFASYDEYYVHVCLGTSVL